ncbi:MAG: VWA domain-containing protein [Candidatus Edwardsbacteria bacterium]|jgi:Ca-activated chloride channel family protein|nr:VWA domain-containing protein [Candidatus Edwardsbacteria bacterium]
MRFASPWYLLLLVPLAGLLWLELRKRRGAVLFSDTSFLAAHAGRGAWHRRIAVFLTFSSLLLMVLALARPQRGRVLEQTEAKGVDIMLCLDVSETMSFPDFRPDRLSAAKQRAREFIARRPGDRFGLVIFAAGSMVQCPLTGDRALLDAIIDRLAVGTIDPRATAVGMGLASAVNRIKGSRTKDKVIVLLTDGLNNSGEIDPVTAARVAQSYGIKVYCIGVGSQGPVTVMVNTIFGPQPQQVRLDLDMKTLDEVAAITGGQSFLATDDEGLRVIYDEIDAMEPTTYKVNRHTVYSERAQLFLVPAALLFLLSLLFTAVIMRKLP